jgi:hypothetical protein
MKELVIWLRLFDMLLSIFRTPVNDIGEPERRITPCSFPGPLSSCSFDTLKFIEMVEL